MNDYPQIEEAWIWPDSVERWFRERAEGRTLHVCCGRSSLGDIRIDIDPDNGPDVIADMQTLPVSTATVETVIWDPPWKAYAIQTKRHPIYYELLRCLKPDGITLTNATWIPWSQQVELEELRVRQDNSVGHASLLIQARKFPGQTTL